LSFGENLNPHVGLAMAASTMSLLHWKSFWRHGTDGSTWAVVKRLVGRYQWRVFFESVVLGIVGLPRGGDCRSTLDMQAASNESCFSPSQDRSGTCRLPSVMSSLSDVVEAGEQARGNGDRLNVIGETLGLLL
jgi:hypothetical protein